MKGASYISINYNPNPGGNMRSNRKVVQVVLVAFALTTFAGAALASNCRDGKGKREMPHPKMVEELGLTSEQVGKIKALHENNKGEHEKIKEKMKSQHEVLNKAMQNNAEESNLRALFTELQNTRETLSNMKFENTLSVYKILTSDQRKKFKGLRKPHHGKKGRH